MSLLNLWSHNGVENMMEHHQTALFSAASTCPVWCFPKARTEENIHFEVSVVLTQKQQVFFLWFYTWWKTACLPSNLPQNFHATGNQTVWMQSWAMCSGMTLLEQGGRTRWLTVILSNLTCSVILLLLLSTTLHLEKHTTLKKNEFFQQKE